MSRNKLKSNDILGKNKNRYYRCELWVIDCPSLKSSVTLISRLGWSHLHIEPSSYQLQKLSLKLIKIIYKPTWCSKLLQAWQQCWPPALSWASRHLPETLELSSWWLRNPNPFHFYHSHQISLAWPVTSVSSDSPWLELKIPPNCTSRLIFSENHYQNQTRFRSPWFLKPNRCALAPWGRAEARPYLHACSPWICSIRIRPAPRRCAPCFSSCCSRCRSEVRCDESDPSLGNPIRASINEGRQRDAWWLWTRPWRFFFRPFWSLLRPLRESTEGYDHQGIEEWSPSYDRFLRHCHTSCPHWQRLPIHLIPYYTTPLSPLLSNPPIAPSKLKRLKTRSSETFVRYDLIWLVWHPSNE